MATFIESCISSRRPTCSATSTLGKRAIATRAVSDTAALSRTARISKSMGQSRSRRSLGETHRWMVARRMGHRPARSGRHRRAGARLVHDAGSIILLHDGDGYDPHGDRMQTAAAVPGIIEGLRDRGLGFVTLQRRVTPATGGLVRWILTGVIVVFLVLFARTVDWAAAWQSIRSASLPLLALSLGVNFLSVVIKGCEMVALPQAGRIAVSPARNSRDDRRRRTQQRARGERRRCGASRICRHERLEFRARPCLRRSRWRDCSIRLAS